MKTAVVLYVIGLVALLGPSILIAMASKLQTVAIIYYATL